MNRIPALHVGQATTVGPVTLFPVWAEVTSVPGLRTGSDATLEVGELGDGPSVGRLSVHNSGRTPVLLVEGELLEGGAQTRALVHDVVVGPRARLEVDVACVEQHRWDDGRRHERRARRATASVRRALRDDSPARQSRVWDDVRRFEALSTTDSGSLAHHLDGVPALRTPRLVRGQNGVVVGVAGHPVALEVFGSTAALRAQLRGILDAALLEASLAGPPAPVPSRRARRFAAAIRSVVWQPAFVDDLESVGWEGDDDRVSVRALTVGSGLAHLAAVTA